MKNYLAYKIGSSSGVPTEQSIKFIALKNKDGLKKTLMENQLDSDLVSGVYEGGLKIWECSLDLVDYISANALEFKDKSVLELGCGQGLPGVMCMLVGAKEVVF